MNKSTQSNKSKGSFLYKSIITALIGTVVFFAHKYIDKKFEMKPDIKAPTHKNSVDSTSINNANNNRDVFQNSGSGQQNNNTDSGSQIINNR